MNREQTQYDVVSLGGSRSGTRCVVANQSNYIPSQVRVTYVDEVKSLFLKLIVFVTWGGEFTLEEDLKN